MCKGVGGSLYVRATGLFGPVLLSIIGLIAEYSYIALFLYYFYSNFYSLYYVQNYISLSSSTGCQSIPIRLSFTRYVDYYGYYDRLPEYQSNYGIYTIRLNNFVALSNNDNNQYENVLNNLFNSVSLVGII